MNLLQISEALKGVPKQFLVQEATQPSGRYPQFMVVAELSRRTSMEKKFAEAKAQMPTQTVAEQKVAEAMPPMPTPTPTTMAMGQTQPNMPSGMVPSEPRGQETMGIPAAVRMYEGGRIKAQDGLYTGGNNFQAEGLPLTPLARQGIENRIAQLLDPQKNLNVRYLTSDMRAELERLQAQIAQDDANKQSNLTPAYQAALENEEQATLKRQGQIFDEVVEDPNLQKTGEAASTPGEVRNLEQTTEDLVNAEDVLRQAQNNFDTNPTPENQEKLNAAKRKVSGINEIISTRANAIDVDVDVDVDDGSQIAGETEALIDKLLKEAELVTPEDDNDLYSEDIKRKFGKVRSNIQKPSKDDYRMEEAEFTQVLQNPEEFQAELDSLRKVDFIGKMQANYDKMEAGIEKDKRQALSLSVIEAGLAFATSASPNVLIGLAGGVKEGLKRWTGIQKDVKKAESELIKAENSLLAARDARQEGDIKAYRQHRKNYYDAKEANDRFNMKARNSAIKIFADNERAYYKMINSLDVAELKEMGAAERALIDRRTRVILENKKSAERRGIAAMEAYQTGLVALQKQVENRRAALEAYQKAGLTKTLADPYSDRVTIQKTELNPVWLAELQSMYNQAKADLAAYIANNKGKLRPKITNKSTTQ